MKEEPAIRENIGRNEDGTFQKGFSGNISGRPKGTMKDYLRRKFCDMTDEEKEEFLQKVSPEMQIKLAEGNPKQDNSVTISDITDYASLRNTPTDTLLTKVNDN